MKQRLKTVLCRRVEEEYKAFLSYLTTVPGSELWEYQNRLLVYGRIHEYIQLAETMPGEIGRCLLMRSTPLEEAWGQYLQTVQATVDSWGDIESLLWGLAEGSPLSTNK